MARNRDVPVSHLTITQVADYVGISHSAVSQRVANGTLASIDVFGVTMIAVDDCRTLWRERLQARRSPLPGTMHP